MSDVEQYDCDEARAHYHQVRRGDVTIAELDRYDAHVADCEACQAFVLRMDGMLDAAVEVDPIDTVDIDQDDLFARIMGAVDADGDADSADEAEVADDSRPLEVIEADDDLVVPASPRRIYGTVALLAALFVAGLGVVLWMQQAPDSPLSEGGAITQDDSRNNSTDSDTTTLDKPDATPDSPSAPTAPAVAIAQLQPVDSGDEHIVIHASKQAKVEVDESDSATRIDLEHGTMLVEFAPSDNEPKSLEVTANGVEVRVVGTIFYVSDDNDHTVVGVVTGKVEVTTADGEQVFVTDGQEFDTEFGIRTAAPDQAKQAEAYVDVAAHREAVRRTQRKLDRAPEPSGKDVPPSAAEATNESRRNDREAGMSVLAATLRDQAAEAVRMRQYGDAAKLYEELIVELPSGHPAAMSARLDQSRLYMRQLGQPERAIPHLKRFIVDRPDDPATPPARETLCRILEARGKSDPACEE
jgi:ferric-dicitrate binding protein FerR (iron transport regulator)